MKALETKVIDLIVIGSGLSGLNFIDTYLKKKKIIHLISPENKKNNNQNNKKQKRILPAQMKGEFQDIESYFKLNKLIVDQNSKVLGILNKGGLSNFWGLQLDNYYNKNQKYLEKKTSNSIERNLIEFLKKFSLLGNYYIKDKLVYKNDYKIPKFLEKLFNLKDKNFECKKPILAFTSNKSINNNLNGLKEDKAKIIPKNFINRINKQKIVLHNYYVEKIIKNKGNIELVCRNINNIKKIIIAKKVVFASGTIATTKILMDYLKIKSEVKIKHHPRLFSVFFSKQPIKFELKFTPSLIQIVNKSKKDYFSADLRPGNKMITDSIIDAFPFMRPFKFFLNLIRHRLIFSNILLDSSFSNIFIKKNKNFFNLYSKDKGIKKNLKLKNKKIFDFLYKNKIILPFFQTFYPGSGSDYHYFGSIPFSNYGKLSVTNNCQLRGEKNIYIVDGSVFDFKNNKYPLGIMVANARRMGKLLSK